MGFAEIFANLTACNIMLDILLPAWLAGLLLSMITAPLGAFVVWRKMAYFGDTLSHSALLGVALGIFLEVDPYIAVIGMTVILAMALVWLEHKTNYSVDTVLGIIAHCSLSLGVITISLLDNVRVDLMSYLFGDLLAINFSDVIFIGIGVIVIGGILAFFWSIECCPCAIITDATYRINNCLEYEICWSVNYYFTFNYSLGNGKTFRSHTRSNGYLCHCF